MPILARLGCLALLIAAPAASAADEVATLIDALRASDKPRIERAFEACIKIPAGQFDPTASLDRLRSSVAVLARAPQTRVELETVVMLGELLLVRSDVLADAVAPTLVPLLDVGPETCSIALERVLQWKTCHNVTAKLPGWSARREAWAALWGTLAPLPPGRIILRGLAQAGLALPPADLGDAALTAAMDELLRGVVHREPWVRYNCLAIVRVALQPRALPVPRPQPRDPALAEIRGYYASNRGRALHELKKLFETLLREH